MNNRTDRPKTLSETTFKKDMFAFIHTLWCTVERARHPGCSNMLSNNLTAEQHETMAALFDLLMNADAEFLALSARGQGGASSCQQLLFQRVEVFCFGNTG